MVGGYWKQNTNGVGWFWFLFGLGLTICQIEISADIHWISWTWSWFWKVCLDLAPILFNLSSFLFPCAAAAAACSRPQNCLESCVFLDCVCFSVSFRMIWNIFFLKGIFISFQSCFAVAAHHERERATVHLHCSPPAWFSCSSTEEVLFAFSWNSLHAFAVWCKNTFHSNWVLLLLLFWHTSVALDCSPNLPILNCICIWVCI